VCVCVRALFSFIYLYSEEMGVAFVCDFCDLFWFVCEGSIIYLFKGHWSGRASVVLTIVKV
jgi:hypothetical protein